MKKRFLFTMLLASSIFFSACGVSQNKYESVMSERDSATAENEKLKSDLQSAQSQIDELKSKNEEYEKIIEPYKKLSEAEIEAQTNKANLQSEKDKAALEEMQKKEAAEKAKKKKEAAAAKAKKEKAGYNTGITYKQLARTPDDYIGEKVKFSGKVLQVMEGDNIIQLRLAVDSDYDNILYLEYDKSLVKSRILEDDYITIYGTSFGLFSYESTMGGKITIPSVAVDKIDQ